jgi:hypothetical protein
MLPSILLETRMIFYVLHLEFTIITKILCAVHFGLAYLQNIELLYQHYQTSYRHDSNETTLTITS